MKMLGSWDLEVLPELYQVGPGESQDLTPVNLYKLFINMYIHAEMCIHHPRSTHWILIHSTDLLTSTQNGNQNIPEAPGAPIHILPL